MPKRPSLFAARPAAEPAAEDTATEPVAVKTGPASTRPPSRVGKRVLSIYLDPIAWRQLRELALDLETSTRVFDLMRECHSKRGLTSVIVTHNPELAARCDRIFEMKKQR